MDECNIINFYFNLIRPVTFRNWCVGGRLYVMLLPHKVLCMQHDPAIDNMHKQINHTKTQIIICGSAIMPMRTFLLLFSFILCLRVRVTFTSLV